MALDLNELNKSKQPIQGLEIRVVEDDEAMRTWAKVFTLGYNLPLEWTDGILDMWQRLGLDLPIRNYLGYLNGESVATASLFFGGGAAGIYSVAVLPALRGKGLGKALTIKPLLDARGMGYRIAVLQSSEWATTFTKN
jgi:predicted GNAT family acetyltransferase